MNIQRIIFDLGNVVLTNDWHDDNNEKYRKFTKEFGVTIADMERVWKVSWDKYKVGEITEDEFWTRFLSAAGAQHIQVETAKKLWREYQQSIEGMLEILEKLSHQFKHAILSNTGKEWLVYKRKTFGLDKYFDVIVGSGDAGFAKPDPKIYRYLLDRIPEQASACIFVDDSPRTLPQAAKLGIHTILFTNQKEFIKQLKTYNIYLRCMKTIRFDASVFCYLALLKQSL